MPFLALFFIGRPPCPTLEGHRAPVQHSGALWAFPAAPGAAAVTIASLPLLAVFASTQRQLVRAAVAGSVKG